MEREELENIIYKYKNQDFKMIIKIHFIFNWYKDVWKKYSYENIKNNKFINNIEENALYFLKSDRFNYV